MFIMDEICRLCLKVSVEMACKLGEESKIDLSCLNIQLHLNDSLPSYVCCSCFKTLTEMQSFRENIIQNEYKLAQLLGNGNNLTDSCENLTNGYISVYIMKSDEEDVNSDGFFYEAVNVELVDQSNVTNNLKYNPEDIKQISYTEEITLENNMSNINILDQDEVKVKRKSDHTNGLTTAITKNLNKSVETENSVDINEKNVPKNISNGDLPYSEPLTATNETEFDIENCEDINNATDEIEIKHHKCLTCFKYIVSQPELIKHYKTVHNIYDIKDFENCNKKGYSKISKSKNLKSKDIEADDKISYIDKDTEEIAKHEDPENSERPYNCRICGRTFTCVYGIVRHGRAHGASNLHCSHGCGYSTVYSGALRDHEKRHEKNFRYKCETCGAGFHVKTWHDQHQNVHKNVKPFICDICGVSFHMHRYLTSHRTSIHPEVGKGDKKYMCPHCDLAFCNKNSYRIHLEEHIGKKKFLCDLCGKVCTSSEQLKQHKNTHLGLKPFSCGKCNKKFPKKFNLTVHEKAHAGEKHLCQICGKYFAQRSTLLRHNRKHHTVPNTEDQNKTECQKVLSFTNY